MGCRKVQYPLWPFTKLVMEPNHTFTLLIPLLIIWLAGTLILRKKLLFFFFQDSAQACIIILNDFLQSLAFEAVTFNKIMCYSQELIIVERESIQCSIGLC